MLNLSDTHTQDRMWENFLNKNSFDSELHFSINEIDHLETQITQLQREYAGMLKILQEPSLIESVPNKTTTQTNHNSSSRHYQGLLQVSSQKLFTGRSHIESKHAMWGQLSENSFLQGVPLINQINQ